MYYKKTWFLQKCTINICVLENKCWFQISYTSTQTNKQKWGLINNRKKYIKKPNTVKNKEISNSKNDTKDSKSKYILEHEKKLGQKLDRKVSEGATS